MVEEGVLYVFVQFVDDTIVTCFLIPLLERNESNVFTCYPFHLGYAI